MLELQGRFVPLPTPFTDDSSTVSEVRLARILRSLGSAGVTGLLVATDTGEFSALGPSERKEVLEMTQRMAPGVQVLVNVSSDSTIRCLDLAQHAARHGARGVIVMPPRYPILSDEELAQHFLTIAKHSQLNVVAVFPVARASTGFRSAIGQAPDVQIAEPLHAGEISFSDEFRLGNASACTAYLLEALGSSVDTARWPELLRAVGRVQAVKTALACLEIEVGPPRSPARPLKGERLDALKSIIS